MRPLFEVRRVFLCESRQNLKELSIDEMSVSPKGFETLLNGIQKLTTPIR